MKAIESSQRLGLALSGGGFRASFYHIGVLAQMAEQGMLKHVESISTVSGGSIVGAAYYLMLKSLLEEKADSDITDQDYVAVVEKLETHFLTAVQKNLRMLTFANPFKNMCMVKPNYSRSDAIGELYDKYIYQPLLKTNYDNIFMSDLLIKPKGVKGDFHPWHKTDGNVARTNKVPVLILNASSLNTGHNWIFTAKFMGEVPPRNLNFRDIDKRDRYRRVRYSEITSRNPNFILGKAVAASAGVPGLFPPMAISDLYKDRRVQLVDGGVYDNQGVAGLLDPDCLCTDFIISDASGQGDASNKPDPDALPVLVNSSGIQGARVREEMVNSLILTQPDKTAYFHLTRGLFARNIEFNEAESKDAPGEKMRDGIVASEEDFQVAQDMQRALAHIRTDLDSFTEIEAGCLQADGYQMSKPRLVKLDKFALKQPLAGNWQFAGFRALLESNDRTVLEHLELARHQFFKPYLYMFNGLSSFKESLGLLLVSVPVVAVLLIILGVIQLASKHWLSFDILKILENEANFQNFMLAIAPYVYGLVVFFIVSKIAEQVIRSDGKVSGMIQYILKGPMKIISNVFIKGIVMAVLSVPIWLYVITVDKYFIKVMGKLDK